MIIKDVYGDTLELSEKKLIEITGFTAEPYYVRLKDLKKKEFEVRAVRKSRIVVPYYFEERGPNTIGCRTFSPTTFAKILKAAGIKTATARKPQIP